MTNKNLFEEYALLDAEEKVLKTKKEELRVSILEDMMAREVEKEKSVYGSFTVTKLKKWEYTEKVEALNEKYKAQKAKEESTGDATYEEVDSLRFTPSKL